MKLGRPREALLTQFRDAVREEQADGLSPAGDPAAIIAAHRERARLEMRTDPVRRLQQRLAKASARPAQKPKRPPAAQHADWNGIIDEICTLRRIAREDLLGPSRRQDMVRARFELLYRLRVEAGLSCQAIGLLVGNRHHTTVSHGVREWCRLNGLVYPSGEDRFPSASAPLHQS